MMKRNIFVLIFFILFIYIDFFVVCTESVNETDHYSSNDEGLDNSPSVNATPSAEPEPSDNTPTIQSNANSAEPQTKTNSSESHTKGSFSEWEKNQRVQAQQELRKKRKIKEREKDNILIAKRTLQAAADENCDWRVQPLAIVRGEVCGSYYKVLGLDRKRGIVDKADIKKAYRQKSLNVHPDKNPSPEADSAFKVVQEAYECLSDDACRRSYDRQLSEVEERISVFRDGLKRQLISKAVSVAANAHYYISVAAHHIYQTGLDIWDLAGEFQISLFGEARPVGKAIAGMLLLWRGRALLQMHLLSYIIVRINYALAKSRGLL